MRNKMEFEARVREIAAQKKDAKIKKQRIIRNFTIVGGVVACAACCAIVFTRMNGINNITGSSDLKNESSYGEHLDNEIYQEDVTEVIMNNSGLPGADSDKNAMENDIVADGYEESVTTRVDSVSIMREENVSDTAAMSVLLDGDNEETVKLIECIEELDIREVSEGKKQESEISYEIKIWQGQNVTSVLIEDNYIKKDDTWYSFSKEDAAVLNEIINRCFE